MAANNLVRNVINLEQISKKTIRVFKQYLNYEQCITTHNIQCTGIITDQISNFNKTFNIEETEVKSCNFIPLGNYLSNNVIRPIMKISTTYNVDVIYLQKLVENQLISNEFKFVPKYISSISKYIEMYKKLSMTVSSTCHERAPHKLNSLLKYMTTFVKVYRNIDSFIVRIWYHG